MRPVHFSKSVVDDLDLIISQGKLDFYNSKDDVISSLSLILSTDPVCIQTHIEKFQKYISAIAYDNLKVIYENTDTSIKVFKIVWSTHFVETGAEHSKEWLHSLCDVLLT